MNYEIIKDAHLELQGQFPDAGFTPFVRVLIYADHDVDRDESIDHVDLSKEEMQMSVDGFEPGVLSDGFHNCGVNPPDDDDSFWIELSEACREVLAKHYVGSEASTSCSQ